MTLELVTTVTATSKGLAASAVSWLGGQLSAGLLSFQILSAPHPQPRPRLARTGAVFYPGVGFAEFRGACQKQGAACGIKGLDSRLAAVLEFVAPRPKATKFESPSGDVDNFAKGTLDALTTAGVWLDDRQIEFLIISKRWVEPGEEPHVNVNIGEL